MNENPVNPKSPRGITTPRAKISAILIARDEAQNIKNCLASIQWVDEIVVVVDSRSTDETEAIARRYTTRVWVEPWNGYAATKNFALQQTTHAWILWIDADEVVPPALRQEIEHALQHPTAVAGFELPRLAWFLGRWIRHGGWYPGYVLRFFQKSQGQFNQLLVHEGLQVAGAIRRLKNPLLHYTDRSIEHYFRKFNQFTSLAAVQLQQQQRKFKLADLIFRPLNIFIKMYVFKFGFLDGLQGFILAIFSAHYVFTKYAKLWELKPRPEIEPDRPHEIC
ncbi:glycosyltransferase family 2 protein [candidate division KSB1 bacterium]|nr:glycosyltransferase family 2 protein [candidate division KSB1 bacterium]